MILIDNLDRIPASRLQPSQKFNTKVSLWQGDITDLEIDVIVNSIHGDEQSEDYYYISRNDHCETVADCIYKAGGQSLFTELVDLLESPETMFELRPAVITKGHQLPAKCKT